MKYGQVETEKLYFSSSEAAKEIGVPVSVLHLWEKEFPALNPQKNKAGKRVYRQNDIETAKEIKENANLASEKQKTKPEKSISKKHKTDNKELLIKIRDRLQSVLRNIRN